MRTILIALLMTLATQVETANSTQSKEVAFSWIVINVLFETGRTPFVQKWVSDGFKTEEECESWLLSILTRGWTALRDEENTLHIFNENDGREVYVCLYIGN